MDSKDVNVKWEKSNYTPAQKKDIMDNIKPLTLDDVNKDFANLRIVLAQNDEISSRNLTGNNVVDFFTFQSRLETRGKYDVSFYDFLTNIEEFKKKKFIQNMLTYYRDVKNKNGKKSDIKVLKEVYNICISAINIMKPLNCGEIYKKYNAKRVLNFCAGWGGSLVAAAALNLPAFYGVEINTDLEEPYNNMTTYLKKRSTTESKIWFQDALTVDYSQINYDMVFSSPPYYFIEKYPHNVKYSSKKAMNDLFYKPLFRKTYDGLQMGGYYVINISFEIYDKVLKEMLGEANEMFPLKKSKRQNDHTEMIYVWYKNT